MADFTVHPGNQVLPNSDIIMIIKRLPITII